MKKETERILKKLKEEFYTGTKETGDYREVFVNPDKSEIQDIINNYDRDSVRFIADKRKKKVYVVASDVLHYQLADIIGDSDYKYMQFFMVAFAGNAEIYSGKIIITDFTGIFYSSDDEDTQDRVVELSREILDGKYDWLERYNFGLVKIKKKAKKILEG